MYAPYGNYGAGNGTTSPSAERKMPVSSAGVYGNRAPGYPVSLTSPSPAPVASTRLVSSSNMPPSVVSLQNGHPMSHHQHALQQYPMQMQQQQQYETSYIHDPSMHPEASYHPQYHPQLHPHQYGQYQQQVSHAYQPLPPQNIAGQGHVLPQSSPMPSHTQQLQQLQQQIMGARMAAEPQAPLYHQSMQHEQNHLYQRAQHPQQRPYHPQQPQIPAHLQLQQLPHKLPLEQQVPLPQKPPALMASSLALSQPTPEMPEKKKRGRPRKLLLDPSTNKYIDSTHENFKQLNKLIKSSAEPNGLLPSGAFGLLGNPELDSSLSKLYQQPAYLRTLDDDAVQQLLKKKDKRGRPRKFPVEQTGLTIKGIRVNGNMKPKRLKEAVRDDGLKIIKRGRPRNLGVSSESAAIVARNASSDVIDAMHGISPTDLQHEDEK